METPSSPSVPTPTLAGMPPVRPRPTLIQKIRKNLGLSLVLGVGILGAFVYKGCGDNPISSISHSSNEVPGKKKVNRLKKAWESAGEAVVSDVYDCRQAMNMTLTEPEETQTSGHANNAETTLQPPDKTLDSRAKFIRTASTISIEVINTKFAPVNAPLQVRELEGAASMTCWKVVQEKNKGSVRPNSSQPESLRKILVLPPVPKKVDPKSTPSQEKQPLLPWDFFYVVDGATVSNIQIEPSPGESIDTFLKRAMTTLHMCTFDKELCDQFDRSKTVASDPDRFNLQQATPQGNVQRANPSSQSKPENDDN
jgi:hypothetical protein